MGKKTTGRKRHLVVDTLGLLLVVMVTSAAVQDRRDGRAILELLVWRTGAAAQRPETQPPHRRLTQIREMRPSG